MSLKSLCFTKDWTLFLDRDGVINKRIPGGYVTRWEDFEFLEGVLEALKIFTGIFGRIIIVSNQQGIGKGLMTVEQLKAVDSKMKAEIILAGGWIDGSYYSPHLEEDAHPDRKPGTGMGLKAKADFPEIEFSKSVMAGDTSSDIAFGKNLGMLTVFIGENQTEEDKSSKAEYNFGSLFDFAKTIIQNSKLNTQH
jgi:histidinol-phosphate phosphatase family protein